MSKKPLKKLEKLSQKMTMLVGTPTSLIVHTIIFICIFALVLFGISFDQILLTLTTALSLEAIYLAIFIQMTVNRTTESLAEVEEDIDDIQEDVDSLETNFKDISEDYIGDETEEDKIISSLKKIENSLKGLEAEIATLKNKNHST